MGKIEPLLWVSKYAVQCGIYLVSNPNLAIFFLNHFFHRCQTLRLPEHLSYSFSSCFWTLPYHVRMGGKEGGGNGSLQGKCVKDQHGHFFLCLLHQLHAGNLSRLVCHRASSWRLRSITSQWRLQTYSGAFYSHCLSTLPPCPSL